MKKMSIIGHFGIGKTLLNGQTIKTKIISDELSNQFGNNDVLKIDTHGGIKSLIKSPFHVFKALRKSKNIIILPAHNGLRVYAPLLTFFNHFYERKLHYVVIGGWLPSFLEKQKKLSKSLKAFNYIYVETNTMKTALKQQGFNNIIVMPNCKKLEILDESELVYQESEPYKLCTFSRVMKEKGIEDAVNVIKAINQKNGKTIFTLDIYGQVESNQTEWFDALQKSLPKYIKYGGLVPFDRSTEILKNYYALLFPTSYEGEGFAGTVIDAYAAGIPVLASDWKYNKEIIIDHYTGLTYKTRQFEDFRNKLLWIYEHQKEWNLMKINCLNEAENYTPEKVIQKITVRI